MTPKYPKPQDEGWVFVIGDSDSNELHALKRVGVFHKDSTNVSLVFYTPEKVGRKIYTLYVMSDSYLGLDQQYELYLDIVEPTSPGEPLDYVEGTEGDGDEIYISD